MKLNEIIELESASDRNLDRMIFYQDGVWYRAYEWSAYLAHYYSNGLPESNRLKPIHKSHKGLSEGLISVGLKLDMVKKFLPGLIPKILDGRVEFTVDLSSYNIMNRSTQSILSDWKNSVPLRDKSNEISVTPLSSKPMTFTLILKKILSYKVDSHGSEDDRKFILELNQMVLQLI